MPRIIVIGLGYVGLPLATEFAEKFPLIGFDICPKKINQLSKFVEFPVTCDESALVNNDVFIIAVPTPITSDFQPDLKHLEASSKLCGHYLRKGSIVVFESTVYPGVTEEFCGPILEKASGLKCGKDFFLGYSPERINPGDNNHTVEKITKIVAGQTSETTDFLANLYGSINNHNIYKAPSIKVAEASKLIENAQRDINIGFINEITIILSMLKISSYEVLKAANTKWNFLNFEPGLVGGHCIGVDPYYLSCLSQELGYTALMTLAGRTTNEYMVRFLGNQIHSRLEKSSKILCLGITFKEDIDDIRNSKVAALILYLKQFGHEVVVHDPQADPEETRKLYGIDLIPTYRDLIGFDAVIGSVGHKEYRHLAAEDIQSMLNPQGLICDIKNLWSQLVFSQHFRYWLL
ncbi:MAG: nucleotide sugar dehydrogenase [Chlorobiaceae bacterium]|nr:nucleotide sugar dehydrogenase [Chlorobiaceae bacterium]